MYIDSQLKLSDAQALTATALSDNVAPMNDSLGIGEPLSVVISVSVAADIANADETYQFAIETDLDELFGSPTILSTKIVPAADLTVGDKVIMPIDHSNLEGFVAMRYTLGGTTPSVTVDCQIMPTSMADSTVDYADGFDIT